MPDSLEAGDTSIVTSRYRLAVDVAELPFNSVRGSIDRLGDGYILASGSGELFALDRDGKAARLPFSIPFSSAEFYRDTQVDSANERFSVKDIKLVSGPRGTQLFAAYHTWNAAGRCFTLRVSKVVFHPSDFTVLENWQPVFDAQPCLTPLALLDTVAFRPGMQFEGHETGGRIEFLNPAQLLITVGDADRGATLPYVAQDTSSSLGKTILLDLASGSARPFTIGHRNPQGLLIDSNGRAWSTEHGPRGGDALDLLQDGGNYGWPLATYGTAYSGYDWPLSMNDDPYAGFIRPVFVWIPSVGVSQLIQVNSHRFRWWKGDFLVASLAARTLFRVHLADNRVVYVEPIRLDERIRDLVEGADGRIAVLGESKLLLLRPVPRPVGKEDSTGD